MAYNRKLKVEPIRTLAFGSIGPTYTAVGTALTNPARIFILNNLTNQNLYFSIDGTNDHFITPFTYIYEYPALQFCQTLNAILNLTSSFYHDK